MCDQSMPAAPPTPGRQQVNTNADTALTASRTTLASAPDSDSSRIHAS
jgi:hypothetical protein